MSIRSAILALVLVAAAGFGSGALAQDTMNSFGAYKGPYISGALGLNFPGDSDVDGATDTSIDWEDTSVMGLGALGYAFGNGIRLEGELSRRQDNADSVGGAAASGDVTVNGILLNAVYDFTQFGSVIPYVGAGIGFADLASDASPVGGGALRSSDTATAWQGFVGAAVPLSRSVAFTAEARYFRADGADLPVTTGGTAELDYEATSVLVGLRWNFATPAPMPKAEPVQAPPPEPAPAPKAEPAPAPEPEPAPPRSFLIFFDWDQATIRADARQILEAAARAYRDGSFVKIDLTGHADRSGASDYNQRLSERRAAAARQVLVDLGIPAADVATAGRGESQPLVETEDGVREPRNRRVEIQF